MLDTTAKSGRFYKKLTRKFAGTKSAKRRLVRYGLITTNLALLIAVAVFVAGGTSGAPETDSRAQAAIGGSEEVVGPLDQLSSVDIAVNVARSVALAEAVAVTNQSDSARITAEVMSNGTDVVAKPQIVSTNTKSIRDLKSYVVVLGDTVSSIAEKFNVTSDSIRWSNDLSGDTVRAGTQLWIPPVNGVVYVVQSGDTAEKIAEKFSGSASQIVAFNDAEVGGLTAGKRIVIPNGKKEAVRSYATTYSSYYSPSAVSFSYGYNGYDPGWCTWYVASRINVPVGWGNANTWDDRARYTPGWNVSSVPRVGAIAQHNRGWAGHVGIVEAVSPDGTQIKYSDMNGIAGFNRVGYSGWVSASYYSSYIYR